MRLKNLCYLLILLLLWGCVDDLVVSTANADRANDIVTSDDDNYVTSLPAWRERLLPDADRDLPGESRQRTLSLFFMAPALRNRIAEANADRLHSIDPLYAFMSLQC